MSDNDISVEYHPDDTKPTTPAEQIKERNEAKLLKIDEVVGVGLGENAIGDPAIIIYARHKDVKEKIPESIEGLDTVLEVVGDIEIQPK